MRQFAWGDIMAPDTKRSWASIDDLNLDGICSDV